MTIAILGANGVYGRHLTPRLVARGRNVRALVRRPEAAGVARGCGADIRVADIFDKPSLVAALEGCDICVNLATSLPGPSGRGDFATNDRVRREGVPILIEACREAGVERLIQQSISWVGASGDTLADEFSTYEPEGDDIGARAIRAARDMEDNVQGSDLDWLILRGGLFYGPGTGFDDDWFARAAAGKLRFPGDGSDFVTLLHIADMAAATVAAIEAWPSRQTIIVADDMPVTWRDLFSYLAAVAGTEPPQEGGPRYLPSFRMSNALARRTLQWAPRYPDYRAGLVR
ncbi:MAG: NAD(P)H-binding protein [Rhizobiaceae bacterium]|nr:NAD(P)H-binding protein [Rhizobiaceae bacterium]